MQPDRGRAHPGAERGLLPPATADLVGTTGVITLATSLVVFQLRGALEEAVGAPARATPILIPLAMLCAAMVVVHQRGRLPFGVLPVLALGLVFVPGIASASFEGYSGTKTLELVVVTLGMSAAAVVLIDCWRRVEQLVWALLVTTAIVCVLGLVLPGAQSTIGTRTSAFGINPMLMARAGSLLAVIAVLTMVGTRWKGRLVCIGLLGAGSYWVVAPANKAGVLAVALGLVTVAATTWFGVRRRPHLSWRSLTAAAAAAGVAMLAAALLAPRAGLDRILAGGIDQARPRYYRAALDEITSNPLGAGLGHFASIRDPGATPRRSYPHNVLLETGSEAGIVAMVAVIALLVAATVFAWRARDSWGRLLAPILVVVTVHAMAASDLNGNRAMFVIASVAVGLGLRDRGTLPLWPASATEPASRPGSSPGTSPTGSDTAGTPPSPTS